MNAQVEKWLNERKQEELKSEKEKRDKHLISLGLIDESKTIIDIHYYYDYNGTEITKEYYEKCKENGWGCSKKDKSVYTPLEITDEEYAEICKYSNPDEVKIEDKKIVANYDNIEKKTLSSASSLNTIGYIIGIVNIICGCITCFAGTIADALVMPGIILGVSMILMGILFIVFLEAFSRMLMLLVKISTK